MDERENLDKVATRPKPCRATLRIPSTDVAGTALFRCNMRHAPPGTHAKGVDDHVERGRVKIGDKELTYVMAWREAEPEVWRVIGDHD